MMKRMTDERMAEIDAYAEAGFPQFESSDRMPYWTEVYQALKAERERIAELERLLKVAKCPDSNCDGKGTVCLGEYQDERGQVEQHVAQCQWCDERQAILKQREQT